MSTAFSTDLLQQLTGVAQAAQPNKAPTSVTLALTSSVTLNWGELAANVALANNAPPALRAPAPPSPAKDPTGQERSQRPLWEKANVRSAARKYYNVDDEALTQAIKTDEPLWQAAFERARTIILEVRSRQTKKRKVHISEKYLILVFFENRDNPNLDACFTPVNAVAADWLAVHNAECKTYKYFTEKARQTRFTASAPTLATPAAPTASKTKAEPQLELARIDSDIRAAYTLLNNTAPNWETIQPELPLWKDVKVTGHELALTLQRTIPNFSAVAAIAFMMGRRSHPKRRAFVAHATRTGLRHKPKPSKDGWDANCYAALEEGLLSF